MDQYSTEEQQVEAIKKFWQENGTAIILGAVLGFGGLWGWRYYNAELISAQERTSDAYTSVIESIGGDDAGTTKAQQFIDENGDTQYAVMTALQLAKESVEEGDLAAAAKQLEWVVASEANVIMKDLANLRLARIQAEQEQFDKALSTLATVNDPAHKGAVEEIKGNIFQRQGKIAEAQEAYAAALAESEGNTNNSLQMKLDDLASQG